MPVSAALAVRVRLTPSVIALDEQLSKPQSMEALTQFYAQFASISAVLGGLSFTAAAALLATGTGNPRALSRSARITVAFAIASTLFLVFASLVLSVLSAIAAIRPDVGSALPDRTRLIINVGYLSLCVGTTFFFVSVGASGWIASRRLGILTGVGAGGIGIGALIVLAWAAQF